MFIASTQMKCLVYSVKRKKTNPNLIIIHVTGNTDLYTGVIHMKIVSSTMLKQFQPSKITTYSQYGINAGLVPSMINCNYTILFLQLIITLHHWSY